MARVVLAVLAVALTLAFPATGAAAPRVSASDRAAIDKLLDEFVPAVVEGKDLAHGWDLVAGSERVVSHAQWLQGNTSVEHYPAKGTTFHGWNVNYAAPGDVGFDILLQPTTDKLGAWSFRAEAQKLGGSWKITTWYPVAEFAPAGHTATVLGPNDLGASNGSARGAGEARLGAWVLVLPAAGLAALALGALTFALIRYLRRRSRVRELARSLARE